MNILSAKEVIINSPAVKELTARPQPVCDVLDYTIEDYLVNKFGKVKYQELLDALIDYSATEVWSDTEDYVENDLVIYDGIPYKLIVAANTSNDSPNCSADWEVAPKFSDECFETTFTEGGLTKLLSWIVFVAAVPFYPEVLQAYGFSGVDPDYKEKTNYYTSKIYAGIARMEKKFERWNADNGCMALFICAPTDSNANKSNRQIAW